MKIFENLKIHIDNFILIYYNISITYRRIVNYEDTLDKSLACLSRDFLIEVKSYVLILNPSNTGGYVVSHSKQLIKAQREFLYDYFIKTEDRWKAEQYLEE